MQRPSHHAGRGADGGKHLPFRTARDAMEPVECLQSKGQRDSIAASVGIPGLPQLIFCFSIHAANRRPCGYFIFLPKIRPHPFIQKWQKGMRSNHILQNREIQGFLLKKALKAKENLWNPKISEALELLARFELATSSLPRMRSTDWAIAAFSFGLFPDSFDII